MICTYEEYIEMPKSITIEKCLEIHKLMVEEVGNDEDAIELYDGICLIKGKVDIHGQTVENG